jgi:omega-6 fatty acid desaturase (delta-12 desaturase)
MIGHRPGAGGCQDASRPIPSIPDPLASGRSVPASPGAPCKPPGEERHWRELIRPYAKADARRGVVELLLTAIPFLALLAGLCWGLDHHFWLALLLILPASAFLVRLFIIQHDCGHGSYFKPRWANNLLGSIIGVFTLTPYAWWRRDHAVHHASSGNLSRRGTGDITLLTVEEYRSRSAWARLTYRLYRHPLILFVVGPAYQFLLVHRIPRGTLAKSRTAWASICGTNTALAGIATLVAVLLGWQPLVIGYLPIAMLAGSIGIWLFYVQHQFESTYWRQAGEWNFEAAAFEGCSFYDLPAILRWLTGCIGFHHIHHLSIKIPSYRLQAAYEGIPAFRRAKRLSLWESLGCWRLVLWDERRGKLVRFRDARG